MQRIHQQDLCDYLRARFAPTESPTFLFIGANCGFADDTQVTGVDFIHNFLLHSPWWTGAFVEPIPSIFDKLKKNYHFHGNRLTFLNVAISKNHGIKRLKIYGRDGKASSLVYDETSQERYTGYNMEQQETFRKISKLPECGGIEVLSITYLELLKMLNLETFDFIKIDAEGLDYEIVREVLQVGSLTGNYPSVIYFESHVAENKLLSELFKNKYLTFPSGLSKSGKWIDKCAIRRQLLREGTFPPAFILDDINTHASGGKRID